MSRHPHNNKVPSIGTGICTSGLSGGAGVSAVSFHGAATTARVHRAQPTEAELIRACARRPGEDPADYRRRLLVDGPGDCAPGGNEPDDDIDDYARPELAAECVVDPWAPVRWVRPAPLPTLLELGAEHRARREAVGLAALELDRLIESGEAVDREARRVALDRLLDELPTVLHRLGYPEELDGWDSSLVRAGNYGARERFASGRAA